MPGLEAYIYIYRYNIYRLYIYIYIYTVSLTFSCVYNTQSGHFVCHHHSEVVSPSCCSCDKVAYLECDVGQTEFTPSGCPALCVVTQPLLGQSPPPPAPGLHDCSCSFCVVISPITASSDLFKGKLHTGFKVQGSCSFF